MTMRWVVSAASAQACPTLVSEVGRASIPKLPPVISWARAGSSARISRVLTEPCPLPTIWRRAARSAAEGIAALGPATDPISIQPRAGDRQLNYALHVMAMAQIKRPTSGRDYYQRKRAAGKTCKEAMRCLKRRLADIVYRTMIHDTETSLLPAP